MEHLYPRHMVAATRITVRDGQATVYNGAARNFMVEDTDRLVKFCRDKGIQVDDERNFQQRPKSRAEGCEAGANPHIRNSNVVPVGTRPAEEAIFDLVIAQRKSGYATKASPTNDPLLWIKQAGHPVRDIPQEWDVNLGLYSKDIVEFLNQRNLKLAATNVSSNEVRYCYKVV